MCKKITIKSKSRSEKRKYLHVFCLKIKFFLKPNYSI